MPRYLKVRASADGTLTPNPHAPDASPRRFAGRRLRALAPDAKPNLAHHLVDHYESAVEVIADHIDLRAAIRAGHLELVGECNTPSLAEALAHFNAAPVAAEDH